MKIIIPEDLMEKVMNFNPGDVIELPVNESMDRPYAMKIVNENGFIQIQVDREP